ncbi:hypothetical protein [Devosia elaeis]|uniref:Uncharacterized protein n=1 Tax=Devosia elaeis TaxID=1770058 RepID=A0A178HZX3_9HYPH|nr:hypothetical protein [Devosia elaeis]OAM78207.1 hypothetical protein A3840_06800 [Devosia elaeis]
MAQPRQIAPASARAHAYPIVSVAYCAAHGITPKAIQASAAFNERMAGRRGYEHCADIARRLRDLADELDQATGYFASFRRRRGPRRQERRAA